MTFRFAAASLSDALRQRRTVILTELPFFVLAEPIIKDLLAAEERMLESMGENRTTKMRYEYDAVLHENPDNGGAYVVFPWDLRKELGKGRVKVHAEFDGIPYDGSIVNMGLKNPDGSVCYVIGVLKAIRATLGKCDGEMIHVVITDRE